MATHPQLCGPSCTVTDTPLPLAPPADQRTRTLSSGVPASSEDTRLSSVAPRGLPGNRHASHRVCLLLASLCPHPTGSLEARTRVCPAVSFSSLSLAGSTVVTQYQGQRRGPCLVVGDKRRTEPPSESGATAQGERTPSRLCRKRPLRHAPPRRPGTRVFQQKHDDLATGPPGDILKRLPL